jgi:hypothetical protein
MEAATSATVTGAGNWRCEPSGSVMLIMSRRGLKKRKKRGGSRAFQLGRSNSVTRDYPAANSGPFLAEEFAVS